MSGLTLYPIGGEVSSYNQADRRFLHPVSDVLIYFLNCLRKYGYRVKTRTKLGLEELRCSINSEINLAGSNKLPEGVPDFSFIALL